jgi:hypothetical protein
MLGAHRISKIDTLDRVEYFQRKSSEKEFEGRHQKLIRQQATQNRIQIFAELG